MTRFHCRHCGDDTGTSDSHICSRCACLPVSERGQREPGADDDRKPTRCVHCLAPVTAPAKACPACLELIADIEADEAPKPRHDGKWMLWACNRRGKLREAQAIGRELGLHRNILRWSVEQVEQVVAALVAAKPR